MYVYNITIKIDPQIEADWIKWQKEEHIPEIMATGLFSEYRFFRLLEQDETDGLTYIVQYFTSSLEQYKKYIEEFAPITRNNAIKKWGDRFVAFRTVMQSI